MAAAAIIGAGTAVSIYGAIKENNDKADAERQNAEYYRDQAQYAQHIGDREKSLFLTKAEEVEAAQAGAYTLGGVEMTGSPLAFMESQAIRKSQTLRAMSEETASRVRLAQLKGDQSAGLSDRLSSFENQFFSVTPTALRGAGSIYANNQQKPGK